MNNDQKNAHTTHLNESCLRQQCQHQIHSTVLLNGIGMRVIGILLYHNLWLDRRVSRLWIGAILARELGHILFVVYMLIFTNMLFRIPPLLLLLLLLAGWLLRKHSPECSVSEHSIMYILLRFNKHELRPKSRTRHRI